MPQDVLTLILLLCPDSNCVDCNMLSDSNTFSCYGIATCNFQAKTVHQNVNMLFCVKFVFVKNLSQNTNTNFYDKLTLRR
jgi:hypothetical protein